MHASTRHDLPLDELGIYMRSMRADCGPVRIASDAELDSYMDGSAGSVGRIMAALLGVPKRFHADFGKLGQAFQLTNFIRDVGEDWEMDRIYLPGVEDLAAAHPRLRDAVIRQVARARALFALAEPASPPPRRRCGRASGSPSPPTCGSSTAPKRPAATCSAAGSACAPATAGDPRGGAAMTRRATLRGAERTPLDERADVLICGASFAGLAVARELAGCGADVLVLDRYEIGERATSACAAPTPWLHAMGVQRAIRQELECMAFHTPHGSARFRLPWTWSSFDYRELCAALWEQTDARLEIATVRERAGEIVRTDRGA